MVSSDLLYIRYYYLLTLFLLLFVLVIHQHHYSFFSFVFFSGFILLNPLFIQFIKSLIHFFINTSLHSPIHSGIYPFQCVNLNEMKIGTVPQVYYTRRQNTLSLTIETLSRDISQSSSFLLS